jgi:hypothetical protein
MEGEIKEVITEKKRSLSQTEKKLSIVKLFQGLPTRLFLSDFPINILHAFLFFTRAKCPSHLAFLDLAILITLGEEYKL